MRYRKKPVEVEAVRFFNGAIHPMYGWVKNAFDSDILFWDMRMNLVVRTLEGDMVVSEGDYIIRGIQGELYPCKPDIFEQTYEEVSTCQ